MRSESACENQRAESEQQRRRHRDRANFQKPQRRAGFAFALERDEPENGGERAGDREVWTEIHADQKRARDHGRRMRRTDRGPRDQARGKVVHEICHKGEPNAGNPGGGGRRLGHAPSQKLCQLGDNACVVQALNKNEETRHQWKNCPGDALEKRPGRFAFLEQHKERGRGSGRKGRRSKLDIEGRGDEKSNRRGSDAVGRIAAAVRKIGNGGFFCDLAFEVVAIKDAQDSVGCRN